MTTSILKLPPEILYEIVLDMFAEYVDNAVTARPQREWTPALAFASIRQQLAEEFNLDAEALHALAVANGASLDEDEGDTDDEAGFTSDEHSESGSDDWDSEDGASDDDSPSGSEADDELPDDPEFYEDDVLEGLLAHWRDFESDDHLPENPLLALLGVCNTLRETTLKVICDGFGLKRNQDGSLEDNPWRIIFLMRQHYRVARTEPFQFDQVEKLSDFSDVKVTSHYFGAYFQVADFGFMLRSLPNVTRVPKDELIAISEGMMKDGRRAKRQANKIGNYTLRWRVMERATLQLNWGATFLILLGTGRFMKGISDKIVEAEDGQPRHMDDKHQREMSSALSLLRENLLEIKPLLLLTGKYAQVNACPLPGPLIKASLLIIILKITRDAAEGMPRPIRRRDPKVVECVEVIRSIVTFWTSFLSTDYFSY